MIIGFLQCFQCKWIQTSVIWKREKKRRLEQFGRWSFAIVLKNEPISQFWKLVQETFNIRVYDTLNLVSFVNLVSLNQIWILITLFWLICYRMEFCLLPIQLEKCYYITNLVYFNKFQKLISLFVCSDQVLEAHYIGPVSL